MKRDANLIRFKDGFLVHACDSAGGIGMLEYDVVKVPIEITARYTLRSVIMEVSSIGATLLSVSAEFSNDPEYSQKAINEIKRITEKFSILPVISTEKNFKTVQTGLGISIVGFTQKPIIGGAPRGSAVFVAGYPLVGIEVIEMEDKVLSLDDFFNLRYCGEVGEMIPVGSSGILEEAKLLAQNSDRKLTIDCNLPWLMKSGGPSSCVVFWAYEKPKLDLNLIKIGILE